MRWRDIVVALSLGNFVMLSVWSAVFSIADEPKYKYFLRRTPPVSDYLALFVATLLFAALAAAAMAWARRGGRTAQVVCGITFAFLLGLAVVGVLRMIRMLTTTRFKEIVAQFPLLTTPWVAVSLAIIAAVACALLLWWGRRRLVLLTTGLLLALFPLVLVNVYSGVRHAWAARNLSPIYADLRPAARRSHSMGDPLVVIMIFDEADYRLLFMDRPSDVSLPHLDRLRKESFFASHAYPPASSTMFSIPALLTGQMMESARPDGPADAILKSGGTEMHFSSAPNIFTDARSLGLSSGAVGWYHPYCRVLGRKLDACSWYPVPSQGVAFARSFPGKVRDQMRMLFETPRLSVFGQSLVAKESSALYRNLLSDALRLLSNPRHVNWLHFSVPHTPFLLDPRTGELTLANDLSRGYLGNLVLMDRTLGAIRQRMEELGTWDDAIVIVTSDHWNRDANIIDGKIDHRVPFLAKLPRQTTGTTYDAPFNTVVTRTLVGEFLRRRLETGHELSAWLSTNAPQWVPVE